jgi:osmotically-inducible protein OsmY
MCNTGLSSSAEQVEALLKERLRTRVQGLRVLVREGGVVLQGTVYTWYSKQIAQQVAMRELRLTVLANEIEVRWDLDALGRSEADTE